MTKKWETTNFQVIDFIDTLENYLWNGVLDYVIVNNSNISDEKVRLYNSCEKKSPIKVKNKDVFKWKSYKVLERDLVYENMRIKAINCVNFK